MDNKDDKNVVASIFGGAAQEGGNAAGDGTAGAVKQEPNTQTQAQTQAQQTEPAQKPAEKLYAGKFKTPEELERAYEEAQRWGTQRSQEAAALKRELEELRKTAAPDMTKKQQEEFDAYVKKAINAAVVDEDPSLLLQLIDQLAEHKTDQKIRQIMPIIEPIAQKNAFQTQVDEFFREHPEALELAGEMTAIVQQDPAIMLDNKGNVRPDWPYRVYMKAARGKSGATQKAAAEAKEKAEGMKAAAAAPGTSARGSQPPEKEEDKIKQSIFGDMSQKRKMFDF